MSNIQGYGNNNFQSQSVDRARSRSFSSQGRDSSNSSRGRFNSVDLS